MPACDVFHEGDAFSFDGFQDDDSWLAFTAIIVEEGESLFEFVKVVPIDSDDRTAERLKFFVERLNVHNVLIPAVNLQTVEVNRRAEVIKLVMSGKHYCLPDLSFVKFAVAQKRVDVDIETEIFCAFSHAARNRNSLTERAGRHINAGRQVHVRMTLQV